MKKSSLFLLLLFSQFFAWAQQDDSYSVPFITKDSLVNRLVGVPFYNQWLFQNRDDSLWSAQRFVDSDAKRVESFQENTSDSFLARAGFTGIGWFQHEFILDSSLVMVPLSIVMEGNGMMDVYLDGKILHHFGDNKPSASGKPAYSNPRMFPIIFVCTQPGKHLIAVRYENVLKGRLNDELGLGFKLNIKMADEAINQYRNTAFLSGTFLFGVAIVFTTLAFIHFMMFLFYKQSISNLYFGLFNLSLVTLFAGFAIMYAAKSIRIQEISIVMLDLYPPLFAFSLSSFVNNLFPKRKWSFWIIIGTTVLYLINLLFDLTNDDTIATLLILFTSIEAIVLMLIAMRKKIAGARILGFGILFFFAFLLVTSAMALLAGTHITIDGNTLMGKVIVLVIMLALFSIPVSISAYLAWSFASTNRSLSAQLVHVAKLSEQTLQQEKEKQLLLQNRKEELEREVEARTHEILIEKEKSDTLLLNILPAEVAQELKDKGEAEARQFDNVSVLFTDFVDFTKISATLSPAQLVAKLHTYFKAFDEIMERNGLEKIKTIGDAYLAVSGIPLQNEEHASLAVKAGLEIITFIEQQTDHPFKIRVGIHSGSLVAGIVGVKKFAYDIWGDTVNTAARMESNGKAGKVNISATTYVLVQNQFRCSHRGKIEVKGKGEMDMYFVDGAI
jgi:adenylate cyclase